jgi:hypothetical protein
MQLPIVLKLATDREDGGQTHNYRVYNAGVQMSATNQKGETVRKNAIMGGNGTIYIGNELAASHDAWVLMPKAMYDQLMPGASKKAAVPTAADLGRQLAADRLAERTDKKSKKGGRK